jgi:hypothetical protein
MFCSRCGTRNADNAVQCSRCGEELHSAQTPAANVPNYLAWSILVTILCCWPFGIPAILNAAQVNKRVGAGDTAGAMAASRKAKMWCWVSFGVGLFLGLVYLVVAIAMAMFSHKLS